MGEWWVDWGTGGGDGDIWRGGLGRRQGVRVWIFTRNHSVGQQELSYFRQRPSDLTEIEIARFSGGFACGGGGGGLPSRRP